MKTTTFTCTHLTCTHIAVTSARHLVDKAISGTPMNCALTSSLEGEVLNLRATLNMNQNTTLATDENQFHRKRRPSVRLACREKYILPNLDSHIHRNFAWQF